VAALLCLLHGRLITCVVGIIWCVVVVNQSSALSNSTECLYSVFGYETNIWHFCFMAVIIIPILSFLVGIIRSAYAESKFLFNALGQISGLFSLVMGVWGILLWTNLTNECDVFYDTNYPSLLLIFKVYVVVLIIGFLSYVCALCLLLVVGTTVIMSMLGGSAERYDSIPDSLSDLQQQQQAEQGQARQQSQASNLPPTTDYV
jgi:hypothetical protein